MFDIGFSELLVIAVVALLVLGPERLPKAARFAGLWVRRARAQWYSVKSELERELAAEDLKRSLQDAQGAMREIDASVREADAQARRGFDAVRAAATDGPAAPAEAATGEAPADAPPAVTPTDHRDAPGYEPEPETDDATAQAADDDRRA
jgi:sec-independent protein translocase protein TatB